MALAQLELLSLLEVPFASYSDSIVWLQALICSTAVALEEAMFGLEVKSGLLLVVVVVFEAGMSDSILLLPSLGGLREAELVPELSDAFWVAGGSKSSSIQPTGAASSSTVVTF